MAVLRLLFLAAGLLIFGYGLWLLHPALLYVVGGLMLMWASIMMGGSSQKTPFESALEAEQKAEQKANLIKIPPGATRDIH